MGVHVVQGEECHMGATFDASENGTRCTKNGQAHTRDVCTLLETVKDEDEM